MESATTYKRAQNDWRLSRLTLTHEMGRMVAVEQIYRANTIKRGLPIRSEESGGLNRIEMDKRKSKTYRDKLMARREGFSGPGAGGRGLQPGAHAEASRTRRHGGQRVHQGVVDVESTTTGSAFRVNRLLPYFASRTGSMGVRSCGQPILEKRLEACPGPDMSACQISTSADCCIGEENKLWLSRCCRGETSCCRNVP